MVRRDVADEIGLDDEIEFVRVAPREEFWMIPKEIMQLKLSLEARVIYGILWTRENADNMTWPGARYLAEIIGRDEQTTRKAIDELVAAKLITPEED